MNIQYCNRSLTFYRLSYVKLQSPLLSSHSCLAAIVLTTWHLGFATLMTQILARFTTVLDSRKKVPMTGRIYLRAIVPIGLMFSLSLICGNLTYLYLSVSFIQMLKVCIRQSSPLSSRLTRERPPPQSPYFSQPGPWALHHQT